MDEVPWLPAWRLRELLDAGELTAVELAEQMLARIEHLEPSVHAFFTVTPELALEQAAASDRRRASNEVRGPLDGIPLSIKDNLEVAGVPCSYGEAALADFVPGYDQIAVERLRNAGAVFLGKTNMPGDRDPGVVPSPAVNPWAPDRMPGRSSAGAATAIASGLGPLALCTDTGGSTRLPAACCGVIGLHPTPARSPAYSYHRATAGGVLGAAAGFLSRDPRDAATALSVIAGPDRRDPWRWPTNPPDYLAEIGDGLAGLRIAWSEDFGIPSNHDDADTPETLSVVHRSVRELAEAGAVVEEPPVKVDDPTPLCLAVYTLSKTDPSSSRGAPEGTDGINRLRALDPGFVELLEARGRLAEQFDQLFDRYDILVCPTIRTIAPSWATWTPRSTPVTLTMFVNLLGLPAVSVPAGFVSGLPVAMQLIGRPDSEPTLLRAAHAFLDRRPAIRYPTFQPAAGPP